jgi:predicted nucleotidyltransferase
MLTINQIKEIVKPIAEKYGLEAVYLFGSQARGDANSESDYDFYIKRGKLRGMFKLSGLFIDLKAVLGKEVDIVLAPIDNEEIDDYLIDGITRDGILIYCNQEMSTKIDKKDQ